jgi:hypothetical protein
MARIRSIHPDTLESVTLARLTDRQERTWWRLLLVCDDAGRANSSPKVLAGLLYPEFDDRGPAEVAEDLDALHDAGLIELYEVGGKVYLAVRSWHEYQHPNRPTASRLPGPGDPGSVRPLATPLVKRHGLSESLSEPFSESLNGGDGDGDGDGDGENLVANRALELVPSEVLPVSQQAATDPVAEVFTAWAATRQHPNAFKLTDERRRIITRRLKEYPVADLVDAVQGWQHDPFSRGENDRGQAYNDLSLILRDAAHVEKFRDLWRNGPGRPVIRDRNADMVRARMQARRRGELPS